MDLKLLGNGIIFLAEMSITLLVYIGTQMLFLKSRWSYGKSVLICVGISLFPVALTALSDEIWVRFFCAIAANIISIRFVSRDGIGKVLLAFLTMYICLVFSESIVYVCFLTFLESAGAKVDLYLNSPGMLEKIRNYELQRSLLAMFSLMLTVMFMVSIYLFMERKKLNLSKIRIAPFLLPGILQVYFSYLCTHFERIYFMNWGICVFVLAAQFMGMLALLWLLWQTGISGKRTMIERELAKFRLRGDSDARQYDRLREVKMELGRFRHDFNNQMQMINCLLEQNTEEGVRKAEVMTEDLLLRIEKWEIYDIKKPVGRAFKNEKEKVI